MPSACIGEHGPAVRGVVVVVDGPAMPCLVERLVGSCARCEKAEVAWMLLEFDAFLLDWSQWWELDCWCLALWLH